MYNKLMQELVEGKYSFFTCYDLTLDVRTVCVKTEDDDMTLDYKFGKYGNPISMHYSYGKYDDLLETMMKNNVFTGQFSTISCHRGENKAKIRF